MRVLRIPCIVAACTVALGIISPLFAYAAQPGESNGYETYTLTPEETVAYYNITPGQDVSNSGMNMYVWYYTDEEQTEMQMINAARTVLDRTLTDSTGATWIIVEYTYQTDAFIDRRNEMMTTIWAQPALSFEGLYSITKGYGFVGGSSLTQSADSNYSSFRWFIDGATAGQNVPFPLDSEGKYITERWSASNGSSYLTNAVTHKASSILPNLSVKATSSDTVNYSAPASTIIQDMSGSSYSRMIIRCPTIVYPKSDDTVIKETLQGIMDSLQSTPEQDAAVSDREESIQSGSQIADDYADAESSVMTEVSLYNPNDYYTYDGDSVTWFGHFWRFVERMPFVMTFSSVGVMFAVLSYVLYGRK